MADQYQELNRVQNLFYTSIQGFNQLSDFEIKRNAFVILQNMGKGFPALSHMIMNIYSPIVKAIESPAILKALQHKFVNPYKRSSGVPKFLYYKSLKDKSDTSKKPSKKQTTKGDEFSPEIVGEICTILMYDSKDYEQFKYTEKVQFLGNQILGEFMKKERSKKKKI